MGFEAYTHARDSALAQGRAQAQQQEEMQAQRVRRQAGNALSAGDYGGASNALFQGGDIQGGLAVQGAERTRQTADRDAQRSAIAAAASGLLHVPVADRARVFQERIAPVWQQVGLGEYVSQVRPENLSDAELRALIGSLGGQIEDAPSGYRWGEGGRQEFIPGGPQDPANQRPIITPYGIMMPPGAAPPPQAHGGQPEYVDQLPPNVRPRPNQPPSAPAAGGGERSQTPRVSFRSSQEARGAIARLAPGVNFTSGDRTPADTARLRRQGYNPSDTSFHLQGQAWDLTPPPGMTMGQLEAKMRQAGFRVLNEGHHIHVSW